MVNLEKIKNKTIELKHFFYDVKNRSNNEIDIESATFGLSKTKLIIKILVKYESNPQNKLLKQIYTTFFSVTRGVESFTEIYTNEIYEDICKGIYDILNDIESKIQW